MKKDDIENWSALKAMGKVSVPKHPKGYIPTDPKLKAIQSGGNWPHHKKKVQPKKYSLGKEINDFYAKQRQTKESKAGGHETQSK